MKSTFVTSFIGAVVAMIAFSGLAASASTAPGLEMGDRFYTVTSEDIYRDIVTLSTVLDIVSPAGHARIPRSRKLIDESKSPILAPEYDLSWRTGGHNLVAYHLLC